MHNLTIIAPADNFETRETIRAIYLAAHPVYVRLGKAPQPHVHAEGSVFRIGEASQIQDGRDLTFIACGETVPVAPAAARQLGIEGITCRVLSMHTIKPLDEAAVLRAAAETRAIITVEEHSVYGGLGEACAAVLLQGGARVPFKIVGFPDEHMVSGSQAELFTHYGLSPAWLGRNGPPVAGAQEGSMSTVRGKFILAIKMKAQPTRKHFLVDSAGSNRRRRKLYAGRSPSRTPSPPGWSRMRARSGRPPGPWRLRSSRASTRARSPRWGSATSESRC